MRVGASWTYRSAAAVIAHDEAAAYEPVQDSTPARYVEALQRALRDIGRQIQVRIDGTANAESAAK